MSGGSGRGGGDGELHSEKPAFSDEGMRRIVYGEDRETMRDSRSTAFAQDTEELEADLRGRRSLVPAVTALAAIFCFGAIVWYAYTWGTGKMASEDLPVVVAEPMPEKVKPEQPGGMEVPHQDIAVLNQGETGAGEGRVEQRSGDDDLGGTMRLGEQACVLQPDTNSLGMYKQRVIHERHRHRYEVNNRYMDEFAEQGLLVAGRSEDGELVEMIELAGHPWFVACQFHPEFTSTPRDSHPLFSGFIEAANEHLEGTPVLKDGTSN